MVKGKTIAIMQPYFMPYIGYWQLINSVDIFVIYDEIQYTKKGWINRNRFLNSGIDCLFSLPLKKGSDYLNINQRELSTNIENEKKKIIRKFEGAYSKAPYYNEGIEVLTNCFSSRHRNLFDFVLASIVYIKKTLDINTELVISSSLDFDKSLKSQCKVIAICKSLNADKYVNPIGGQELYNKIIFSREKIDLCFQQVGNIEYSQFNNVFVPSLSIIDVIMFNGINKTKLYLDDMRLI